MKEIPLGRRVDVGGRIADPRGRIELVAFSMRTPGTVRLANAGHPPLVLRQGPAAPVQVHGYLLGVYPHAALTEVASSSGTRR